MKQNQHASHYLFLLNYPSVNVRREGAKRLRELGLTVVAQYGRVALEVIASPEQARSAFELGIFSTYLKGPMDKEHFERLNKEQQAVVSQWNTRFEESYRKLKKDKTHVGKSWATKGMAEPLPFTAIDPEEFKRLIEPYRKELGLQEQKRVRRKISAEEAGVESRVKRMKPEEFVKYERQLAEKYKNPNLAYHLARLMLRLDPEYEKVLLNLPPELIKILLDHFFRGPEQTCWKMTGEISVGVVFVESSQANGPKFGNTERNEIYQEIIDGLSWLSTEHPSGDLSWVYDVQYVEIDVANGTNDSEESYWRNPAMAQVTYNGETYEGSWDGVAEYREDMRTHNDSAHAIVIFVTPYGTEWHAYASNSRVTLAKRNNWGGWGRATIDRIAAHEVCHLFGSADEYTGSGTPCSSCETTHGCNQIPNGNCGACARPAQACVMNENTHRLCSYTRGHIGWSDIFVELYTADESWAGTDDDVWLDIGDRTFVLDNSNHNDRERGNREGYAIWAGGIDESDIKRVLIRKSSDGFAGGWRLARVRVWHNETIICDESPNQWLEDDHLTWIGCINGSSLVNSLTVRITTADVMWAGTDDDVTLRLAGRSWNLDTPSNDFERGNTDAFTLDPQTGFYTGDIHSVNIEKSPDGIAGGWKLAGVQIIVNGTTVYNNQGIDRWLEDDSRIWTDGV